MAGNNELTTSAGIYSKEQANEGLATVDEANIDTVPTATVGNLPVFNLTGNLVDSNISASAIGNVGTKAVSEGNIGDGRILAYNSVSGELEYVDNSGGGGGGTWGTIIGNILDQTDLQNQFASTDLNISNHIGDTTNPHAVTKTQVGLSAVDNTSDTNKPISTLTQAALDGKEDGLGNPSGNNFVLASDTAGNRTWLDASALGVTSVNGKTGAVTLITDDINEGVANLYYTATRADSRVQAAIQDTVSTSTTLYSSSKIDALLSGALNYKGSWDATTNTPTISDATGANGDYYKVSVGGTQDLGSGPIVFSSGDDVIHNGTKFEDFGATNAVTSVNGKVGIVVLDKVDIGLANVDNTTDLTKPISNATQSALDDKSPTTHNHDGSYEPANGNIQSHIGSTTNPHAVTKAQVGLDSVDNTADVDKPVSTATQTALNAKANQSSLDTTNSNVSDNTTDIGNHVGDNANPHAVTKAQLGLSNVDNTTDANKPVSIATQSALDAKENGLGNPTVDAYVLTSTIAGVRTWVALTDDSATWGNVGGLLANQTDLQNALNAKSPTTHNHAGVYEPANVNIQAHIIDMNNPHGTTATMLGLGNVDDTSDVSKPVSDATQTVLDEKMRFKGDWVPATYNPNDVVKDGSWTMVALVETEDRAGPQPVGDPLYGMSETPTFVVGETTAVIHSGQIFTFTKSGWLTSLRVWIPELTADTHYKFTYLDITNPANPIAKTIPNPLLTVGAWNTIAVGSVVVEAGSVFKFIVEAVNSGNSIEIAGGWFYLTNSNTVTPTNDGEWSLNRDRNVLNINKIDLDGLSRAVELAGVTVSSTVQFVQVGTPTKSETFQIQQAPVDNGSYFSYSVIRTSKGSEGTQDKNTITDTVFSIPVSQPTEYVEEVGSWATNPVFASVEGFVEFDGVNQPAHEDDGYGIDVRFQEAYISPDWGLLASSGTGSSTGTSTGVQVVDNLLSTDSSAALSANMGRELNVIKADLAGNNTQTFKVADGVAANDAVNFSQATALLGSKEDYLGTPSSDNMVLVSTTGNVRTWTALPINTDIAAVWGNITGLLGNQTDLQDALDAKSPITHNHDGVYEPANGNIQPHIASTSNPHLVTKSQVGLGNVDNTSDVSKPISVSTQNALNTKSPTTHNHAGVYEPADSAIQAHLGDTTNPHLVTKSQVGLGDAENTADLDKPVSNATQTALNAKANQSSLNTTNSNVSDNTTDISTLQTSKEDYLGLPAGNNYVLSSDNTGVRTWVDASALGVTSVNGKTGVVVLITTDINEGTNLYYTAARADARVQAAIQDTVSSTTTLYSSAKIDSLVAGALTYKGGWDASNNTPAISDATGSNGDFYKVDVAGTQNLGSGSIDFAVGDDVIHNGIVYERFGTTSAVDSVNGKLGVVVLTTSDINEGTNLYYTDARVDARLPNLIDDGTTISNKTWSSTKIDSEMTTRIGQITAPVSSVNGKTGIVTITKGDVQLGNVDNTSDVNKPLSDASITALAGKSPTNHLHSGVYEPANTNIQGHIANVNNPHDTTMLKLSDSPASYAGAEGYSVHVNEAGTGVEFVTPSGQFAEAKPTGLEDGGELNIVNGGLGIEVVTGIGLKIDSYSNPAGAPTKLGLSWNTVSEAIAVSSPIAGDIVYIMIADGGVAGPQAGTNLGVIQQFTSQPSPSAVRDDIYLGYVLYNGTAWGEISAPIVVNNSAVSLAEYIKTVAGPSFVQQGGGTYESSTFSLSREAGIVWELNRNWHVNKKDPHRESFNEALDFQFRYTNRDFTTVSALASVMDPTNYDNNGTVGPIGGNNSQTTIQRVFIDQRDNYWVLYGQNIYDNFEAAIARIGVDEANTTIPSLLKSSIFLGYVVSEKSKTAWAPDNARFVSVVEAAGGGDVADPITTFAALTDTPTSYSGQGGKGLIVNQAETGVEYFAFELGIGTFYGTNIAIDSSGSSLALVTGIENTAIGYQAGEFVTSGSANILMGTRAGRSDGVNTLTGGFNVAIGHQAGMTLTTGADNVLLGSSAGETFTTQSNKLVISNTVRTLISGDFATRDVDIDGELRVDLVTFDGNAIGNKSGNWTIIPKDGQYQEVTLTGSGALTIATPSGPCTFYLHIHQDSVGGRVLTLPTGKWVNGITKPNTTTANAHDLLMIHYYGGTNYVYEMMLNLS